MRVMFAKNVACGLLGVCSLASASLAMHFEAIFLPEPDSVVAAAVATPHGEELPRWALRSTERVGLVDVHHLSLTSQLWRSAEEVDRPQWTHNVVVAVPMQRKADRLMLMIGGGRFRDAASPSATQQTAAAAMMSGLAVAYVDNVPAQPLDFAHDEAGPLVEDAILSESWVRSLETNDPTWIVHKAMVLAVRGAMTSIEEHLGGLETPITLDGFTLMGGSKRGWTAWLTALEDERVRAVIPAVIPLLNMRPHFEHHKAAYGFWAPTLKDYEERGLLERIDAADFGRIAQHVDPFFRRDELTLPKYIVNAAGDEFFLPDSDQFYIGQLPGHTSLLVRSGAGHSVTNADGVIESIMAWAVTEASLGVEAIPTIAVEYESGSLTVTASTKPERVTLATMTNATVRDFRTVTVGREWAREAIEPNDDGRFVATLAAPDAGWTAHVVEVTFVTPSGLRLIVSSQLKVLPEMLPFSDAASIEVIE
ncbi:MAG: hypothetical protein KF757_11235 [Phycisphaeraceae bacterium]|nr:hypothetical protein [Phycisphaeraceae bacterium]MCW5762260.1 hypothetical protein [Phycisphaeraceae bacterium]